MSAEFYAIFKDPFWYATNLSLIEKKINRLETFNSQVGKECRLLGSEDRDAPNRWTYDVRLFLEEGDRVLIEICAHPPSIEHDLSEWLTWLKSKTDISIEDEDGLPSGW